VPVQPQHVVHIRPPPKSKYRFEAGVQYHVREGATHNLSVPVLTSWLTKDVLRRDADTPPFVIKLSEYLVNEFANCFCIGDNIIRCR
jgi:hypothetical protein